MVCSWVLVWFALKERILKTVMGNSGGEGRGKMMRIDGEKKKATYLTTHLYADLDTFHLRVEGGGWVPDFLVVCVCVCVCVCGELLRK